ncbi:O-antigen ligase family protein [Lactobacillus rodentium]|uniref:O-antigen ligase n=1 Tax=Lactobacillus rodentium TaxID=947835 RepID=A0A2Z6T5W0_9LACO|nr:O-antigen ligase family protein [Lactobacillus rodentium]MCR1894011.1 O-antigen ligase family protein [Lactobacillus rodentium]GBG04124.1 hypothetical protein LrDSM24759_00380 [Lactobacillus rodentium]
MQKKINRVLFWFILIQPFLELDWFYKGRLSTILPFTIPTIIRIVGVFVVFLMFFSQKNNWQRLRKQWWVITYIILLIIYIFLHLYHVRPANFHAVDPSGYGYSTFGEIFYLLRMILPIIILYITRYTHFSEKQFEHLIQTLSGLFSLTIILTNLFVHSLTAYGSYGVRWIHANIFAWFTSNNYAYFELASKGFFYLANTISAILFFLMPLMLYFLYKDFKALNIILVVAQSLAMLMLGTKVGAYGLFIDFIVFFIFYLVHLFILKNIKVNKKFLLTLVLVILGSSLIVPHSPMFRRNTYDIGVADNRGKKANIKKSDDILKKDLKKYSGAKREKVLKRFIKKHYYAYSLKKGFVLKGYSYKYDPDFWLEIMKSPVDERLNYRHLEIKMLNKVVANNHNKYDKFLGISYIRENNIFPLERDFLAQYYSTGIIGVLLFLGIYIYELFYLIYSWFKSKANRQFINTIILIALGFILTAAFYSGNVMDYLTATLIMAFVYGYALQLVDKSKAKKLNNSDK